MVAFGIKFILNLSNLITFCTMPFSVLFSANAVKKKQKMWVNWSRKGTC